MASIDQRFGRIKDETKDLLQTENEWTAENLAKKIADTVTSFSDPLVTIEIIIIELCLVGDIHISGCVSPHLLSPPPCLFYIFSRPSEWHSSVR